MIFVPQDIFLLRSSGVTIIFAPPPANVRYGHGLTVLIHNSGHFGPLYCFVLPMASYATARGLYSLRKPRFSLPAQPRAVMTLWLTEFVIPLDSCSAERRVSEPASC